MINKYTAHVPRYQNMTLSICRSNHREPYNRLLTVIGEIIVGRRFVAGGCQTCEALPRKPRVFKYIKHLRLGYWAYYWKWQSTNSSHGIYMIDSSNVCRERHVIVYVIRSMFSVLWDTYMVIFSKFTDDMFHSISIILTYVNMNNCYIIW